MDKRKLLIVDIDGVLVKEHYPLLLNLKKYFLDCWRKYSEIIRLDREFEDKYSFLEIIKKVVKDPDLAKKIYERELIFNKNIIDLVKKFDKRGWEILILTKRKKADFVKEFINGKVISTRKPDFELIKKLSKEYDEIVYIGDKVDEDIIPGKSAGISIQVCELPDLILKNEDLIDEVLINNEVYDYQAEFYYLKYGEKDEMILKKILDVIERYNIKGKILDYGCGIGWHVKKLREKGLDVHGFDISKPMIKEGKKRFISIKDFIFDITPKENYSFIYAVNISFDIDKRSLEKSIKEIKELLKKGGMFLLNTDKKGKILKRWNVDYRDIFVSVVFYPELDKKVFVYEFFEKRNNKKIIGIIKRLNWDIEEWLSFLSKYFKVVETFEDKYGYYFICIND